MDTAAPNIVMVVLDDLGFADFGCYGSGVATPNIDGLAQRGLRYNHFHVTPLCAPSRACLLTGRNHHSVGVGFLTHAASDYPGYTSRIPKSAGSLARILRDAGYNAFAVGKWHLTPQYELGPTGPFDRWPLGLGFERFYGFMHGMANQYSPELVRDNGFIEPPSLPDDRYHLTEDLASQAIRLVQDQQQARPDKPFFLYFAPGAVHAPHQVRSEWVEPYRHQFDDGWDVERERRFRKQVESGVVPSKAALTPRPSWVSAWGELSDDRKRLFARQMEVYAGFVTHTDTQIGRVLEYLASADVVDNTIVMVLSDNGAEGATPDGALGMFGEAPDIPSMLEHIEEFGEVGWGGLYARGWAWACNTPLKLWKCYTWLGGVRVPLIVRWPGGIEERSNGEVRSQFAHAVDLMPTILDAAGVEVPDVIDGVPQQPLAGRSLLETFAESNAPSPRLTQYFEMLGSRSIYHDGWKATTDHVIAEDALADGSRDFDADRWALFRLGTDFAEANDLSEDEPERLAKMIELWWDEARRNQVLPLLDSWIRPAAEGHPQYPVVNPNRDRYVCFAGTGPVETPCPFAGEFRLTAELELARGKEASGIICAHHLRSSGFWSDHPLWACYVIEGRPTVTFNVNGTPESLCVEKALPDGRCELRIDYSPAVDGGACVTMSIDGEQVAAGAVNPRPALVTPRFRGMLLIGWDRGSPLCADYRLPFDFTGRIRRAVFEPGAT